jgi:hypothetical protein
MNTTTATATVPETTEQLVARLTKENEELKAKAKRSISLKVSQTTGCVCIYGMGRFPISAYRSQWIAIFDMADKVRQFMLDNGTEIDLLEALNKEAKAAGKK